MAAEEASNRIGIKLKFYGPTQRYLTAARQGNVIGVELEVGQTLEDAVRQAGFSPEVEWSAVVGDRIVSGAYLPQAEETITILPPLAGG